MVFVLRNALDIHWWLFCVLHHGCSNRWFVFPSNPHPPPPL